MRIEKSDGTIEHKCKNYRGKIKDVSYRQSDNSIRCRACNQKLALDEVDPKILEKLVPKLNKNEKRRNRR